MPNKSHIELQLEILKLEELISDFEYYERIINAVVLRESVDKEVALGKKVSDSGLRMFAQQAYEGYSLLIRAYITINADMLSVLELEKLKNALKILESLHKQCHDLYFLDEKSYPTFQADEKARIFAQLQSTGEIYILGGFYLGGVETHHALIKYTKVGDSYTRTEFNEGMGAEHFLTKNQNQYGFGVNSRSVNSDNLKKVISIDVDTLFANAPSESQVAPLLEPRGKEDKERSIVTTLQTLSNCSTRSVRAMLREALGQKLLRGLYETATTPALDTLEQLILKHSYIQKKLEQETSVKHVAKPKPARVSIAPVNFTIGMDVRKEVFNKFSDALISQIELILDGSLTHDDKVLLKDKVLKGITAITSKMKFWSFPYLEATSLSEIAVIMAKTMIDNKAVSVSEINKKNSISVSSELTDKSCNQILNDGLYKGYANFNRCESELGIDEAITIHANNVLLDLRHKKLINFNDSMGANVAYAKFIILIKSLLIELGEPYRIDNSMLKIIASGMLAEIDSKATKVNVPFVYTLDSFESEKPELIEGIQKRLKQNSELKDLEKTTLSNAAAKPKIKKLSSKVKVAGELAFISATLDKKWGTELTQEFLEKAMKLAINHDNIPLCKRLLKAKANINTQDNYGNTLLMKAAKSGDTEWLKELLAAGADLDLQSSAGKTALMLAIDNNQESNNIQLIQAGCDLALKTDNNKTLLQNAIRKGDIILINNLLLNGAKLTGKDIDISVTDKAVEDKVKSILISYSADPVSWLKSNNATPNQIINFLKNNTKALSLGDETKNRQYVINAILDFTTNDEMLFLKTITKKGYDDKPMFFNFVRGNENEILNAVLTFFKDKPDTLSSLIDVGGKENILYFAQTYLNSKAIEIILNVLKDQPDLLKAQLIVKNRHGTFIHNAVKNRLNSAVSEILTLTKSNPEFHDAYIKMQDEDGNTVAHTAASIFMGEQMLKSIIAAANDDPALLHSLLEIRNNKGETLLFKADSNRLTFILSIIKEKPRILKDLLEIKNTEGLTLLLSAVSMNYNSDIIKIILNALHDHSALLKELLKDTDKDGNSVLLLAMKSNYSSEMILELIQSGADVTAQNNEGVSPLQLAIERNDLLFIDASVIQGVNFNKPVIDNKTALTVALELGHQSMALKLIGSKAKVNVRDEEYTTPLMQAAAQNNIQVITALSKVGADPNLLDKYGNSALLVAMQYNLTEAATELLKSFPKTKLEIKSMGKDGKTALGWAIYHNNLPLTNELLQKGAHAENVDIDSTNKADPKIKALLAERPTVTHVLEAIEKPIHNKKIVTEGKPRKTPAEEGLSSSQTAALTGKREKTLYKLDSVTEHMLTRKGRVIKPKNIKHKRQHKHKNLSSVMPSKEKEIHRDR